MGITDKQFFVEIPGVLTVGAPVEEPYPFADVDVFNGFKRKVYLIFALKTALVAALTVVLISMDASSEFLGNRRNITAVLCMSFAVVFLTFVILFFSSQCVKHYFVLLPLLFVSSLSIASFLCVVRFVIKDENSGYNFAADPLVGLLVIFVCSILVSLFTLFNLSTQLTWLLNAIFAAHVVYCAVVRIEQGSLPTENWVIAFGQLATACLIYQLEGLKNNKGDKVSSPDDYGVTALFQYVLMFIVIYTFAVGVLQKRIRSELRRQSL